MSVRYGQRLKNAFTAFSFSMVESLGTRCSNSFHCANTAGRITLLRSLSKDGERASLARTPSHLGIFFSTPRNSTVPKRRMPPVCGASWAALPTPCAAPCPAAFCPAGAGEGGLVCVTSARSVGAACSGTLCLAIFDPESASGAVIFSACSICCGAPSEFCAARPALSTDDPAGSCCASWRPKSCVTWGGCFSVTGCWAEAPRATGNCPPSFQADPASAQPALSNMRKSGRTLRPIRLNNPRPLPPCRRIGPGRSMLPFSHGVLPGPRNGFKQIGQDGFLAGYDIHRCGHAGNNGQRLALA